MTRSGSSHDPASGRGAAPCFVVARNPDANSKLPYLLRLPLDGGLVLKARERWPATARVYCHAVEGGWPEGAEVVEEVAVVSCRRRGAAVDLVLDRPREARSQFVFTETRGRAAIFWQTQKVARTANPGGRVPRRKALASRFTIVVDSRECYAYRFAGRDVTTEVAALPAGDYGVRSARAAEVAGVGAVAEEPAPYLAVVERKSLENFADSLVDGTMAFQLAKLAEQRHAAVVVEGRYPALCELPRTPAGFLADVLARLQLRYPEVQVVFADSRKFAEEWTFRFLAAAREDEEPAPGR